MLKNLKKDGFSSFVEIMISAVVFAIAAVGMFSMVSKLKPKGDASAKKLEAMYAAKSILDELRGSVDARTWLTGPNDLLPGGGVHSKTRGDVTVEYTVTDVPGSDLRQVSMNVIW